MCLTRVMSQNGGKQPYAGGQMAAPPLAPDIQERAAGQALPVDLAESGLAAFGRYDPKGRLSTSELPARVIENIALLRLCRPPRG